jgi:diguanylate cyclase (GGDEF)-like protein
MKGKDVSGSGGVMTTRATSPALLAEVLESIGTGACIWDGDLRLVGWNSGFGPALGLPARAVRKGATLAEILDVGTPLLNDKRTGAEIEAMARKLLVERGSLEIDRVLVDGRTLAVSYHRLSTGGWIAIYLDVTERRQAVQQLREHERELRQQTARLDAALDTMPYGFCIWSDDYRLVEFNRRYAEIYALPRDRLRKGMPLVEACVLFIETGEYGGDVSPEVVAGRFRESFGEKSDIATQHRIEFVFLGRTISANVVRLPGVGWVITNEDITDERAQLEKLKDRERELSRQKLRLEAAVNNMSQGLCMFDADRRLVICNDNYARIYGLPPTLMQAGTRLEDILAYRYEHGIHPAGSRQTYFDRRIELVENRRPDVDVVELQDGRVISVIHHPIGDGGWVSTHQDITEQRKSEARIRHLARHDALTDLPNRLMFRESMEGARKRIDRGEVVAIVAIDLDHFKTVNDTLGHNIGDTVLKMFAERLRASCREGDTVARLGGDEFAVLTGALNHPQDAAILAERIVRTAAEPFDVEGHNIMIGASVGIAVAPGDGVDADALLKNADLALYRAKGEGRGAFHFFEKGMDAALQERRSLELGLRQALARNEFRLVFQPLFNLKEGKVCGLEALLRWYHPERGTIPPAEFVPIAEEAGLIVPIGEWVLREACGAAVSWPPDIHVAVNLSAVQFRNRHLYAHVKSALDASGLQPDRLELEVTESLLLTDSETTLRTLHELRKLGVRISMDDFGTGYSSLSYLRSFPFDKIKIDKSFVSEMSAKDDSRAIVKAVIGLGRSLGMSTAAEGIETEAQLDLVRQQGCTEVQGFLLSPPLPASAVERLFADANGMDEWTQALKRPA